MNNPQDIIHLLYNSFSKSENEHLEGIKEALLKVYKKLDSFDSDNNKQILPLLNKLVKRIYFTAFTYNIHFSKEEEILLRELSDMSKHVGFYRL